MFATFDIRKSALTLLAAAALSTVAGVASSAHASALAASARLEEGRGDTAFYRAKLATARFYADQMLPQAIACAETVKAGDSGNTALGDAMFTA